MSSTTLARSSRAAAEGARRLAGGSCAATTLSPGREPSVPHQRDGGQVDRDPCGPGQPAVASRAAAPRAMRRRAGRITRALRGEPRGPRWPHSPSRSQSGPRSRLEPRPRWSREPRTATPAHGASADPRPPARPSREAAPPWCPPPVTARRAAQRAVAVRRRLVHGTLYDGGLLESPRTARRAEGRGARMLGAALRAEAHGHVLSSPEVRRQTDGRFGGLPGLELLHVRRHALLPRRLRGRELGRDAVRGGAGTPATRASRRRRRRGRTTRASAAAGRGRRRRSPTRRWPGRSRSAGGCGRRRRT